MNVRLRLEDVTREGDYVELTAVTSGATRLNEWQTISWDFSSVDHSPTYDKASVYFDAFTSRPSTISSMTSSSTGLMGLAR